MSTPFGHPMRQHFLFSPSYKPLNHGSWGTYPNSVRDTLHHYQALAEASPDTFMRYDYPPLLDKSRQAVADLLHVNTEEVVMVSNTTTATNEVLRALKWEDGDVIVYFEAIYGALEKTILYVCEMTKAESLKIEVAWPVSDDELLRLFDKTVDKINNHDSRDGKKRRVRLATFDTISSMPGIRLPWESLVARCKALNIYSLVDGAHGIGHIPLDNLSTVQPDFFASNLHKWLFVPRGCALFYVPLKNQHLIRSALPTSHGFRPLLKSSTEDEKENSINNPLPPANNQTPFTELHAFVATLDNSPYLCVPTALKFRQDVCGGEDKIIDYCMYVARKGGKAAARILGTEVMDNAEETLTRCAFATVRLPLLIGEEVGMVSPRDKDKVTQWIARTAATELETYFAIVIYRDSWWVRLSGQVYLEVVDFVWGAERLGELCERVRRGEVV